MKMWYSFKSFVLLSVLTLTLTTVSSPLKAQCPMCRLSAESNLKDGGKAGAGLNAGILYLLATPYVLVTSVALIWWWNRRKEEEEDTENALKSLLNDNDISIS